MNVHEGGMHESPPQRRRRRQTLCRARAEPFLCRETLRLVISSRLRPRLLHNEQLNLYPDDLAERCTVVPLCAQRTLCRCRKRLAIKSRDESQVIGVKSKRFFIPPPRRHVRDIIRTFVPLSGAFCSLAKPSDDRTIASINSSRVINGPTPWTAHRLPPSELRNLFAPRYRVHIIKEEIFRLSSADLFAQSSPSTSRLVPLFMALSIIMRRLRVIAQGQTMQWLSRSPRLHFSGRRETSREIIYDTSEKR